MTACPTKDELERLLGESLSDPEFARILAHVEDCAACQEFLQTLAASAPGPSAASLLSAFDRTKDGESTSHADAFLRQLKQRMPAPTGPKPEVDGYEIFEELGRGAASVVYRARRSDLNRFVALKVIAAGPQMPPQTRERFRREVEAIARLAHANVVQVYDVGQQRDFLYLAMELIKGGNLTSVLGAPQPAREAAQLIATVSAAVDYAHRQGVVHRDLKPANILLQHGDGASPSRAARPRSQSPSAGSRHQTAIPKITDFGLAKLLPGSGLADDGMTQSGAILGTPAYAAPEQASGHAAEAGPTSDVFSLGVILYELLTGRPPFQGANAMETLVQVAHQDPVPPMRLVPKIPRDLQTICLKCLEKDPRKRYATAGELTEDLERFLHDRPILARPVGRGELTLRWMRRNKATAAALGGLALVLFVLVAGALVAAAYFRRQEAVQENLASEKTRLANENETERQNAVVAATREAGLRQLAEKQEDALDCNLYIAEMNMAGQAATSSGGVARVLELLSLAEKHRTDLRNWEWYYLDGLCHRDLATLRGHQRSVMAAAWSPDGRQLASAGDQGVIQLWDANRGETLRTWRASFRAIQSIAWSPDRTRLATASWDGAVKVWEVGSGKEVLVLIPEKSVESPDGITPLSAVFAVAWSPDGKQLVSGGEDSVVHIWDAAKGSETRVIPCHNQKVLSLAWSPDANRLASALTDSTIRIWDTTTGKETRTLRGHLNWVNSIAWNPKGTELASASKDRTVKVWSATDGKELLSFGGHSQSVSAIAWSPDGAHIATASDDRTVKIWPSAGGSETSTFRGHTERVTAVAWSPDGKRLASASGDMTVKIWDARAAPEPRVLHLEEGPIKWTAWSPDGEQFACACNSGIISIWDKKGDRQQVALRGHRGTVYSVSWSPDGRRLASAGNDRTVRIWDVAAAKQVNVLEGHTAEVISVSWSPDGTRLASTGLDRTIRIWDALSGKPKQTALGHRHWVRSIAWSPDGRRLASGSTDMTVRVWDAESCREILPLPGHLEEVSSVAWNPNGESLASASGDGTIKIWDATAGKVLLTLRGHNAQVKAVAWSPDGTRLASASWDETVKVWDARTGKQTLTFGGNECPINTVAWSPDGLAIVSGAEDQSVVIYDASVGHRSGLAPRYLPVVTRRLAADPKNAEDWHLAGEIEAGRGNWKGAAADFDQYLALDRHAPWVTLGDWVAGPYPDDLSKSYPPERDVDPLARVAATGDDEQTTRWERVPTNASGFVNFSLLYGRAEHISAYALMRIYSPVGRTATLWLGSDDQARVWLNGKQIHESRGERAAIPDSDAVPATLNAGWNTLLVRVTNQVREHALYARLAEDSSARPRP
jgi:eukaryotic-like serine/threonine-protein kinase